MQTQLVTIVNTASFVFIFGTIICGKMAPAGSPLEHFVTSKPFATWFAWAFAAYAVTNVMLAIGVDWPARHIFLFAARLLAAGAFALTFFEYVRNRRMSHQRS